MIEVVNLATCPDFGTREGDVYIGRSPAIHIRNRFKKPDVDKSKWGNPFRMYGENERAEIIRLYRKWILQELQSGRLDLAELRGAKRLGCWCAPKACHGDVLKELLEKSESIPTRKPPTHAGSRSGREIEHQKGFEKKHEDWG